MKRPPTYQMGFAAIAAVFLVVVLAALGAFMVSFSNTQQLTSAQDIQGSRAYWAARAGLEWGVASVTTACPTSPTVLNVEEFTVTVTCNASAYTDAGAVTLFEVTALTKSAGTVGGPGYIERSLSATLEK